MLLTLTCQCKDSAQYNLNAPYPNLCFSCIRLQ